jgi:serine/threonine-protein kinase
VAQHDLSGVVIDGRYQVIEPIADGAMGAVYRGERLKLGKAVAIKIMHDALPDELASRQRFEREAKLMARLEHPHVVSVIDFGLHDDKPFLVMDLVRGTSLQQLLDKVTRIEPARAVELVRQVLSGLGHAHELGIVHRDIKPANIMLTEKTGLGEQVRILDFGLARPASETTKLTTGIVVGTPNYMAPEQIKGGDIDGRTDLYAVGVMLFELVTGEKPFTADDPLAVVRKHLNQPPPTLATTAPGIEFGDLEAVVARALAKSPSDRFATAAEMSAALEKASNKSGARKISELMGRAVPQTSPPSHSARQVATASGWAVQTDRSTPVPTPMSNIGSAPATTVGSAGPGGAVQGPLSGAGSAPATTIGSTAGAGGAVQGPLSGAGSAPATTISSAAGAGGAVQGRMSGAGSAPAQAIGSAAKPRASSSPPAPFAHVDTDTESGRVPTYPVVERPSAPIDRRAPSSPIDHRAPSSPIDHRAPSSPIDHRAPSPPIDRRAPSSPIDHVASAPVPGMSGSGMSGPVSGAVVRADGGQGVSGPMSGTPSIDDSQAQTSIAIGAIGAIPPTRGRASIDRPIPQIPLTRRQLMVAGGGLVLLVIIIVAATRGGASAKAVTDAAVAQAHADASPSDPVAPALARASDLYSNGELESALDVVAKARRQHPESAQLAFLAGKIYFGKLWWSDGIKGFRDAIKLDPGYRNDSELAKIVLRGFITTPDTDSRIEEFLRQDIGEAARPLLEETAKAHPNAAIRARAAAELRRFK